MEIIFLRGFLTDIKRLNDKKLKTQIKEFIVELENSENLEGLSNVKKLKGFSSAYRWRVADYRLGFYKDDGVVELARFVKRNDIYKVFP